jgi:crotonobetainyl-CoA:carnitine CoA-transferase CaiB-like acyl-CoA transferase
MQTMDQILDHPQTAALGILQASADGRFRLMGPPLSFDGARPPLRHAPPALGEHTGEVLGPFKEGDA